MIDSKNLAEMRRQYITHTLHERDISEDPILQFERWFNDALKSASVEPNAMILATAGKTGIPSVRAVLLKKFDHHGFVFFTNCNSRKGRDISTNPTAQILFFWPELERQIRISGTLQQVSPSESDIYFESRPYRSKIAACASPQSEIIPDRDFIEQRIKEFEDKFQFQKEIPRPSYWGGFCLVPEYFEFWQGREDRLHDRLIYTKCDTIWKIQRLAP
ncbi:MAG: pyridoxamine 5'-phosphate oxidase [Fibrobacter sp.]|nr:pyridoxamine 5'-phosphate oxidase [Fibrobacter sp.]